MNHKIICRFLDVNPITHGGGVVRRGVEDLWEFTLGAGLPLFPFNEIKKHECVVLLATLDPELIKNFPQKDLLSINSFSGRDNENKIENINKNDIQEWADIYHSVFLYFGSEKINADIMVINKSELMSRWGLYRK